MSLWVVTFAYLYFCVIVPSFRKTFYSSMTGKQSSLNIFINNEANDEARFMIFEKNREHWSEISDQVREWTLKNWKRWTETKPGWFTPFKIASVPDNFIPDDEVDKLGGEMRERRGTASRTTR